MKFWVKKGEGEKNLGAPSQGSELGVGTQAQDLLSIALLRAHHSLGEGGMSDRWGYIESRFLGILLLLSEEEWPLKGEVVILVFVLSLTRRGGRVRFFEF